MIAVDAPVQEHGSEPTREEAQGRSHRHAGSHIPARSSRGAWALLLVVTAVCLALDLVGKELAFRYVASSPVVVERARVLEVSAVDPSRISALIPQHPAVKVVPNVLEFTLVLNPGAVFGMGAGQRWFFMVFTGVALGFALYMFAVWTSARDRWSQAAIGMLISGGLGNLYDRWVFACVRDFIHPLPGLKWPFGWRLTGPSGEIWPYVSNIADLFLIIGIAVLAVRLWRAEAGPGPRAAATPGGEPGKS